MISVVVILCHLPFPSEFTLQFLHHFFLGPFYVSFAALERGGGGEEGEKEREQEGEGELEEKKNKDNGKSKWREKILPF